MKRLVEEPLVFPIGDKEYKIPPVGVTVGWQLAEIFEKPAKTARLKNEQLFRMAMGDVYEEMVNDGVGLRTVFRAGMACLAHFQTLSSGGTTEDAMRAADGIWEAGIGPKAVEEWAAANPDRIPGAKTPGRRTAAAGASTASTSGTSTRKASTPSAPRARAPRRSGTSSPKRK